MSRRFDFFFCFKIRHLWHSRRHLRGRGSTPKLRPVHLGSQFEAHLATNCGSGDDDETIDALYHSHVAGGLAFVQSNQSGCGKKNPPKNTNELIFN